MKHNSPVLVVLALFLVSLGLRLIDLGGPTFWLDEGYSLATARLDLEEMWHITRTADVRFPLFYLFLHQWIQWVPNTEFWLRLPQVVAGAAAVVVAYQYALNVAGRRSALTVAAVLATSHYLFLFEQECRMYSWIFLAQAGYLWALARLSQGSYSAALGLCLSTWLGCYSDYRFGIFAALCGLGALWLASPSRRKLLTLALTLAALGCGPLFSWFRIQSEMTRANLHLTHPPLSLQLIASQIPSLLGAWYLRLSKSWALLLSGLTVLGLGVRWSRLNPTARLSGYCFLGTWLFLIAYSQGIHPVYSLHSAMILAYPFFLWLGLSLASLPKRPGLVLVVLWALFNLGMTWRSHGNLNWHKQNWRELARLLQPVIPPQELVVVVPAYQYFGLSFYWEPPHCLRLNPRDFLNPEHTEIIRRNPSCWFIMANDLQVDRSQFVRHWMEENLNIDQAFQIENAPYYEINGDSIQIYHATPKWSGAPVPSQIP